MIEAIEVAEISKFGNKGFYFFKVFEHHFPKIYEVLGHTLFGKGKIASSFFLFFGTEGKIASFFSFRS